MNNMLPDEYVQMLSAVLSAVNTVNVSDVEDINLIDTDDPVVFDRNSQNAVMLATIFGMYYAVCVCISMYLFRDACTPDKGASLIDTCSKWVVIACMYVFSPVYIPCILIVNREIGIANEVYRKIDDDYDEYFATATAHRCPA